jgi:hypothetical protein
MRGQHSEQVECGADLQVGGGHVGPTERPRAKAWLS